MMLKINNLFIGVIPLNVDSMVPIPCKSKKLNTIFIKFIDI